MPTSLESTLLAAFAGENAYEPDFVMANWNPVSFYHTACAGPKA